MKYLLFEDYSILRRVPRPLAAIRRTLWCQARPPRHSSPFLMPRGYEPRLTQNRGVRGIIRVINRRNITMPLINKYTKIHDGDSMIHHWSTEAPRLGKASAWLLEEYKEKERRIDLVDRYNKAVGEPGTAVAHVQDEFISSRMEPQEVVNFVGVCEELLKAYTKPR